MPTDAGDRQWMARAIQLAEKGRYTTRPNPCVGCVIVRSDQLLAEGWHYQVGGHHAEVHALSQLGQQAHNAIAYVTLEPCNHQGRTGPCTQALIAAGITRVVYGTEDPNPLVSGQGLATLRAAGIQVDGPLLEPQAKRLNLGFSKRMQQGLPWVRCKLACSLDGRTAMANGESQWITSEAARRDVQLLRARSGAIVTGIGSILQDNSRLTLRADELDLPNRIDAVQCAPLRVVLDSQWRLPDTAAVLLGEAPTLVVVSPEALAQQAGRVSAWRQQLGEQVTVCSLPTTEHGLNLMALLRLLADDYQVNDVLVEAGATLSGAFIQQHMIDELIIYQAPIFLGSSARPLAELPLQAMADKYQLLVTDQRQIGSDWRISAVLKVD